MSISPLYKIYALCAGRKGAIGLALGGLSAVPAALLAQTALPGGVESIFTSIEGAFTTIITILFALGTLTFIWGVIKYIISKGPEDQAKAKNVMLWGIIGLAVIAGMWGFARILISFFGAGGKTIPTAIPEAL